MRQKLARTCAGFVEDERLVPLYPFAGDDRATNIAVMTAAVGGADFLVTQNKRLQRAFENPESGAVVTGISYDELGDRISSSSFDLVSVNPRLW